jgi:polyhydroxybutyrate depolymerase
LGREYLLHVPKRYTGKLPVPLVLMLHGRGSSSKAAASDYYGWTRLADQHGFIAAFPEALGQPRSWKPAWGRRKTSDGTFLAKLIDAVQGELRIDADRVFMTGHSSGGIMSFSFAATHSDRVAAIGPVAGTIGTASFKIPEPRGPVSVISLHGMADNVVAYDRERGKRAAYRTLISAPESVGFWVGHNGCKPEPVRTELQDGRVFLDTWSGGARGSRVELYSIAGGSHAWPSGRRSIAATPLIWKFFAAHPRQPAVAHEGQAPVRPPPEQPQPPVQKSGTSTGK